MVPTRPRSAEKILVSLLRYPSYSNSIPMRHGERGPVRYHRCPRRPGRIPDRDAGPPDASAVLEDRPRAGARARRVTSTAPDRRIAPISRILRGPNDRAPLRWRIHRGDAATTSPASRARGRAGMVRPGKALHEHAAAGANGPRGGPRHEGRSRLSSGITPRDRLPQSIRPLARRSPWHDGRRDQSPRPVSPPLPLLRSTKGLRYPAPGSLTRDFYKKYKIKWRRAENVARSHVSIISRMVRASTGRMTPFSVMMPAISSAGVTSKAGL